MSDNTLYDKIWARHNVGKLPTGQNQLFVARHLMHEVTSPQAFEMLRERGLKPRHPELTFATVDHVIPTCDISRPFADPQAELMAKTLEDNLEDFGISYFGPGSGRQGVCHVSFAELGLILPGMVAVCGDSHTCTYGAFGALSFGIGTTQVAHVLATQTLAIDPLKVRRIELDGEVPSGVSAKDLALFVISELGVEAGVGYAYEFAGVAVDAMSMEGRMTLCNMAVEGGARSGYVNPDGITFDYLRGRDFVPEDFEAAIALWKSFASGPDAVYDDRVTLSVSGLAPMVSWGVNPAQSLPITAKIPPGDGDALSYMGLNAGDSICGLPVDVVFIGSCTNGRLSDLEAAAEILKGNRVATETLVVPGSEEVKRQAEERGLDRVFIDAGAQWRHPGCSMCLAMNPDKLCGTQRSLSTSNRNFKGRQGSATGRTHLASPYVAAASAIEGKITDPTPYLED